MNNPIQRAISANARRFVAIPMHPAIRVPRLTRIGAYYRWSVAVTVQLPVFSPFFCVVLHCGLDLHWFIIELACVYVS